jgi:hypothetical protein
MSYEFTTPMEREALATNITVALAAIRMQDAEVHLRIAHRPYPAAEWATGLDATSDGGPGWLEYLDEMYRHVWSKDFWSKEIYLGVRLGQRGMRAQLSGGVISQFLNLYKAGEQAAGLDDEAVSAGEIARWTEQAERLGRALGSSALAARHARADDIAWLFRHALMGTAGDPRPSAARRRQWGAGEIEYLLEGQVHNGRGFLRRLPVVRALPRRHVLPGRGAVAALRRLPPVPGRGQPADEADPARQGQQGRRPAAGARPGHGRAHQGSRRGSTDRPG